MLSRIVVLVSLCLSLTLVGCATQPPAQITAKQALPQQWALKGKVGVKGKQSGSASIHWQTKDHSTSMTLSGPFGQGRTVIEGTSEQATITRGGVTTQGTLASLIEQATGMTAPLKNIPFWLAGTPAPFSAYHHEQQQPTTTSFEQSGWTVQASKFTTTNQYTLPTRLVFKNADSRIILVIHEWSIQ